MGNRRFAQIATSDDEDDDLAPQSQQPSEEAPASARKRKLKRVGEESEEEKRRSKKKKRKGEEEAETASEGEEEEEEEEDEVEELEAKPIGEIVKVSGKGRTRRNHYQAFEYDGNQYELEDPVLLTPSDNREKPYVAIIKDITQLKDGNMVVLGQWFYRPDEAEKKGGGNWQSQDTRELFYSFHRDECPAESVMHKCVVHFVPLHKQLPKRKEHPGFIVQKVYDTDGKKLWKLTDRDYEEDKQHEIDLLVQKTMQILVDLPDLEIGEINTNQDDPLKSKRNLIKKNIAPLDVSRVEEATTRPGKNQKAETPGSCATNSSEYHRILVEHNALTGDSHRDRWLEKLIKELQFLCSSADSLDGGDKIKTGSEETDCKSPNGRQDMNIKGGKPFLWPDDAVRAATSLEKASHDSLSSDFQKYNQKVRSLCYNLSVRICPLSLANAFKEAHPDAADEEAENVVEVESVQILELAVGRRKGNEVRAMGRAGKLVASTGSGSGSSRRRRGSSSAEVPPSEWQAKFDQQSAVIKKQNSKLSKLGKTMKLFANLLSKIMSATGVEHAGIHEALQGAEELDDDDDDDEDDAAVDMSAQYSQVRPAHSRPSVSGGIVMIPTPGLQPPLSSSGKGKGIADY